MRSTLAAFALLFLFLPAASSAQVADTVGTLPEIRVEATRSLEAEAVAPFSLVVLTPDDYRTEPSLTLQDVAGRMPGVWIADRGHFALGERVVIRGMGARSPFGIRGIHVVYDGIPLTMPDGQAITDMIDPFMVRRVELVRGPSSIFWGNASGGTLFLSSLADDETTIRATTGSHGRYYLGGRTSLGSENRRANAFVSHMRQDGFRAHSDGHMTRAGVTSRMRLSDAVTIRMIGAAALQDVRSPGSLTYQEWTADPAAANPSYINTRSGKWSGHGQLGLTLERRGERSNVDVTVYGIGRNLENPLPFAFVEVGRSAGGIRSTYTHNLQWAELSLSADIGHQTDQRRNFANVEGERGPTATLDQQERVTSAGAAGYLRVRPNDRWRASAGVRLDGLHYAMDDQIEREIERSGSRRFGAVSPALSLMYLLDQGQLYASVSTSFETPTTTELVNNPAMISGFNADLGPERTRSVEVGARGWSGAVTVDASAFVTDIRDRIASFRTDQGGDRDFFRNAASGTHAGGEISIDARLHRDLRLSTNYAGLRAIVREDDEQTTLPGVPAHQAFAEIRWSPGSWLMSARIDGASSYFADDANVNEIDGFAVTSLGAGFRGLRLGRASAHPFIRISNLLDETYVRSVVVNASFGRFYEPAAGRTFEIGTTLDL